MDNKEEGDPILIVEDDPPLRRWLTRVLKSNHYPVVIAEDGTEGLRQFEAYGGCFRLAIVDMVMPGMSGLDLAAELERRRPDLRILYISGHGDSVAIQGILHTGKEVVLVKPFEASTLLDRVRCLMN